MNLTFCPFQQLPDVKDPIQADSTDTLKEREDL